jgi:hypothetical protein
MHPIFHGLAKDRPSTPKPYDLGVALIAMAYGIVVFWGVELVHFDR